MAKKIKKNDDLYQDALSWMAYRYAIGITEYPKRSGQSEAERYRMFRDIEFDTEEFHALAGAFIDFLKRKKITDIVQLRDRYRENDLIWLSRNYAMGRHSYAASHCEDIISYSDEVLSSQRKEFMAHDIRRELGSDFLAGKRLLESTWRQVVDGVECLFPTPATEHLGEDTEGE